jgi:hypothetical protein
MTLPHSLSHFVHHSNELVRAQGTSNGLLDQLDFGGDDAMDPRPMVVKDPFRAVETRVDTPRAVPTPDVEIAIVVEMTPMVNSVNTAANSL